MTPSFAQLLAEPLGSASIIALGALAPFLLLPAGVLIAGRAAADIARPAIDLVERVSQTAERAAQALLVLLLVSVATTVVLRYVFGVAPTAIGETSIYAHALGFLMAAPAALGRDAHVRVDVFYARLSEGQKDAVNLAAFHLFTAPMLLVILHFSGAYVAASWRIAERSIETDGLPIVYLVKTAIPAFAVLLLAQAVAEASRAAMRVRGLPAPAARFSRDAEPVA